MRAAKAAIRQEDPETTALLQENVRYRVLNRHGLLGPRTSQKPPHTKRPQGRFERATLNKLGQVAVSYSYIQGGGYYYLHIVLDDHSCYVIPSRLYRTYGADDGFRILNTTLAAVPAVQRQVPELFVDHGVTYTVERFGQACTNAGLRLLFASAVHPHSKGKIERWHRAIRDALWDRIRQ